MKRQPTCFLNPFIRSHLEKNIIAPDDVAKRLKMLHTTCVIRFFAVPCLVRKANPCFETTSILALLLLLF